MPCRQPHPRPRRLGALLAALFLGGCLLTGDDENFVINPATTPGPTATNAAEDAIGANEHPRILAAYGGIYENAKVELLMGRMVGRIIAASDEPSRSYRITLLNSPAINAFALPGGYLYVTRGLLALANDEAEVAAVLAHEMSHVIARHAMEREREARTAQVVSRVVSEVLHDPSAAEARLAVSERTLAVFSRNQELEADAAGVRIIGTAGYDPFAAARFLESMGRFADLGKVPGSDAPNFLTSHPATPSRIEEARKAARRFGAPGIGAVHGERYLEAIDGLLYGDDPSEGFVRGRVFTHPALQLTFSAPEGYQLENTPQAILGTHANGAALRFDAVDVPATTALEDYLASGWIDGLQGSSIRKARRNGLDMADALARSNGWIFRVAVIRADAAVYRFIFASKDNGTDLSPAVASTLASFRKLSPAEVAAIKPLSLRLVRVRDGDTIASLSSRMRNGIKPRETFMALNGLQTDSDLVPGTEVKIVVD